MRQVTPGPTGQRSPPVGGNDARIAPASRFRSATTMAPAHPAAPLPRSPRCSPFPPPVRAVLGKLRAAHPRSTRTRFTLPAESSSTLFRIIDPRRRRKERTAVAGVSGGSHDATEVSTRRIPSHDNGLGPGGASRMPPRLPGAISLPGCGVAFRVSATPRFHQVGLLGSRRSRSGTSYAIGNGAALPLERIAVTQKRGWQARIAGPHTPGRYPDEDRILPWPQRPDLGQRDGEEKVACVHQR
jgi:hypothetical protein